MTTNLSTRGQVLAACETALREESTIVVEQFVRGDDYRLLVVGNRVVAAARRDPPAILGDGLHTVAELVAAANDDPRRAEGHAAPLTKLILDTIALEVLAEQGLLPESVPAEGTRALIRRNGNLSTGGSATDVTDDVHPEVAACAIDAARMVGLDVAGIDILAQDIAKPLEEQGGAVIEVNACPGLRMHLHPSHGTPRPVGDSIIDLMFARGESARVPIVAVAGDRDQTTTSRLVAHLLAGMPGHVGLANADGLFVSEHRIEGHDPHDPSQAKSLLLNPLVESAVIAVEPTTILRGGLPFDQCEVAILTEFAAVDASTTGDEPHDDLALANLCLLKSVASSGTAVLNADDRQLAAIADRCTCEMIYFSHDEEHAVLLSHRLSGGRVVFVRDHCIFAAARHHETLVAPLDDLAFTYGGLLGLHVDSALAAVAACWSLGLRWKDVRAALTSFTADLRPLVDMPGARR